MFLIKIEEHVSLSVVKSLGEKEVQRRTIGHLVNRRFHASEFIIKDLKRNGLFNVYQSWEINAHIGELLIFIEVQVDIFR